MSHSDPVVLPNEDASALILGPDEKAEVVKRPNLVAPILAVIVFFPLGVPALVNALNYRSALARGDEQQAVKYAVRARELAAYAFGLALAAWVVAALVAFVLLNGHAVLNAYFDVHTLKLSMGKVSKAFVDNVTVSLLAEVGILLWAMILVLARMLPGRPYMLVRALVIIYIDVFRALPALLTILLIGYGLPATGISFFAQMSLFQSGAIALVVVYGAYVSEIFRGAIASIPAGQMAAARSLGLGFFGAMRYVIMPQAIRSILPSLLNWYISVLKDTSLLSVLGLVEGLTTARILVTFNSNLSPLVGVALCFLVVILPLSRVTDYIMFRDGRKRQGKV